MRPRAINPAFGERVRDVLTEHGLTMRGQKIRTGIDHPTISEWCAGLPPASMDKLVHFCRIFGLPVNDWLVLAGFDPIPLPAYNGGGYFILGLRRLRAQLAAELNDEERAERLVGSIRFAQFPGPDTPIEHVEQALRDLETDIREELGAR